MKQSTVLGNKRLPSQSSSWSSNSHGCCVGWWRFGENSAACFPAFSAFTSKSRRRDSNGCGRESPRCVRRVDFQHLTLGSGSAITSAINKFPHAKQCQQWVCCFLIVRLFGFFFSPALLCLNAGVWLGLVIVDGLAGLLVSLFHFVYHCWIIFVFGCCQLCPELYLHINRNRINADLSVALNASEVGFTLQILMFVWTRLLLLSHTCLNWPVNRLGVPVLEDASEEHFV